MLPNHPVFHRRIESLFFFLFCLVISFMSGFSWLFFLVMFFLPDVGAIGYLKSPRLGGIMYNLTHWYVWPVLLIALSYIMTLRGMSGPTFTPHLTPVALIWAAHISFDRMLGWGLKTEESFYHTDMGLKPRIGRKS